MKNVNEALKNEIKDQVETIRGIRAQINGLKWKPESREQVAAIGAKRRSEEKASVGKSDLKPFRRPETGPERHALWDEKRSEGAKARYLLLAYGALRGRTYLQIEPKCGEENKPSAYAIWNAMPDHVFLEVRSIWTESAIEAWLKGTPLPLPEPAPMAPAMSAMMGASL